MLRVRCFIAASLSLIVVAAATDVTSNDVSPGWEIFKYKYNKRYDQASEVYRRKVWQTNMAQINRHNELFAKGKSSFYLSENKYSDMTSSERKERMHSFYPTLQTKYGRKLEAETADPAIYKTLPASVDWRRSGAVTRIKDQDICAASWAFAATGALEGHTSKVKGYLTDLSPSNLIDCTAQWGNHGCRGGTINNAYQYIIDNGGIDGLARYPYEPSVGYCGYDKTNRAATMSKYVDVKRGDEKALQLAVATMGPVSVAIDASHDSFLNYGGGIYSESKCSKLTLDHAVLVVGYGRDNGSDYWLVKNSWGEGWGDEGYIYMTRNQDNQCGIATLASYPVV